MHILFEDNHCLAVLKPAGLPTQAPAEFDSLEAQVKSYLREKCHKKGRIYLGIPHRLDRPVSGVVLFARQTKSAQRLAEQFRNRQVTKIYWAAVEGDVQPEEGIWEDWIRKIPGEARAECTEANAEGAKRARLHYRRLQEIAAGTLLEIHLETGRMHQIRAQAAVRGHPVLGDVLYGSKADFRSLGDVGSLIALHARSLTFLHPIRYEPVTVFAPMPEAWRELGIEEQ